MIAHTAKLLRQHDHDDRNGCLLVVRMAKYLSDAQSLLLVLLALWRHWLAVFISKKGLSFVCTLLSHVGCER